MNEAFEKWMEDCKEIFWDQTAVEVAKKAWIAATPQWQPIETALKDGTEIMGFSEDGGINIIKWNRSLGAYHNKGEWVISENYAYDGEESIIPTRWQPLPAVPKKDE